MRKNIINMAAIGIFTLALTACVSGNIGLYCAAAKLATVPRASMDKEALTKALNLKDTQILILNNPVGYMK